jgi:deazaflavin-dependent oxidoreductase (nitroreductase family)
MSDFNAQIIEEFRANAGKVGGDFAGAPMVLLHTIGARTGVDRVNPLVYGRDGDNLVVFASRGGAPTHPDWFHNLVAHPDVTVEVGTDTVPVRARVAEGDERERLWARQKELMPGFAEYEAKTTRQIPVIVLEPVPA